MAKLNLAAIVTITTCINPDNTDGELVCVYSKEELTEEQVRELYQLYKADKVPAELVALPACLGWCADEIQYQEHDTNVSRAMGLWCYIAGDLS
jgi:hypothetical protein